MCLDIDFSLHHRDNRGRIVRRRATQDILVYKVLTPSGLGDYGTSPYMNSIWTFGNEKTATMKVYDSYAVEEGLHSCLNEGATHRHTRYGRKAYPAVIPKGSLVIYGDLDEVASNRLIVYRDVAQLVKARGAIGPGVPRGKLANFGKVK